MDTPCSTGNASFVVVAGEITLSDPEFTSLACDGERATKQDEYLRKVFSPGALTFTINESHLTFSREDMEEIAVGADAERAAD